jgi:capsular polysaccharide biosynthesis protein
VRADLLLVSSNLLDDFCHPAHLCAEWALDFLRARLPAPPAGRARRKIFVSRADAVGRNLINGSEVERALRDHGFEIVTLSGQSAQDQIELFNSASHVIGVHGGGLTNVLFSPPGTSVLEVLPPLVATGAYWTLCSQLGHSYSCLIADDPEYPRPDYSTWLHRPEYDRRNIILPVESLIDAVERMGGSLS